MPSAREGGALEVLFVTANLPYPPTSGATIRSYNLIKKLAPRHRVHLVAYGDAARSVDAIEHFRPMCASVTVVPFPNDKNTPRFYLWAVANLLSRTPFVVSRFTRPAMVRAVRSKLLESRADLIHCDFLTMALNIDRAVGTPMLLTAHNVESLIWKRYLEHERNPLRALYVNIQYRKLERLERQVLRRFEAIACVSREESETLHGVCPKPKCVVIPNGVDVEHFRPDPHLEEPDHLVFTGSMDWRPNQDAVRYFLDEIYSEVKRRRPRAKLSVVGRWPPSAIRRLADRHPDVEVVGTVPDMRPYLGRAAVYVVPLRIGGGTRLKILEAMAMARPVVSTGVGCEGLDVEAARDLMVADRPDDFARAVVDLLGDRAKAEAIGRAGRERVVGSYDWGPIADRLEAEWRWVAGRRRGAPCAESVES